jgi:hypothetical protein
LIFAVDHVVLAAACEERERVGGWIESHGFRARPFPLDFPGSGASSESWSYGSGGFLEFVVESERGAGAAEWFSGTPRVIGLGFASDDFGSDTSWESEDGVWRMNEDHVLPDGAVLTIDAAGPHRHASSFYVFVMNRSSGKLEFDADPEAPTLARIVLTGADANLWRENLGRWLKIPVSGRELGVGDVTLEFVWTEEPGVRASLVFSTNGAEDTHALAAGSIVLGTRE